MNRRPNAFTLVELLVVIGIIAVLLGVLMPVLSAARTSANHVRTLSDMRQLMTGYTSYHLDHNGALPWGYPPRYVDGEPFEVETRDGVKLAPLVSRRYPWRLADYIDNAWAVINSHRGTLAPPLPSDSPSDYYLKAYDISVAPAFGMNAIFVGGHSDPLFKGFVGSEPHQQPNVGSHVVFRSNEVRRASDLIVFSESRMSGPGFGSIGEEVTDGFHVVHPPRAAGTRWWAIEDGDMVSLIPTTQVGLPRGRSGSRTVVGFFDGHCDSMLPSELDDMRLWAARAETADYDFVEK